MWLGDREIGFLFPFLFGLSPLRPKLELSGALQTPEKGRPARAQLWKTVGNGHHRGRYIWQRPGEDKYPQRRRLGIPTLECHVCGSSYISEELRRKRRRGGRSQGDSQWGRFKLKPEFGKERAPWGRGRRRRRQCGRGKRFGLGVGRLVQPLPQTLQDCQHLPHSVDSSPQSGGCFLTCSDGDESPRRLWGV